MGRLDKEKFVCIDCESTGLDTQKDQIIEVGVVCFTFSEILETYETLVDPGCPIPPDSTKIHHITDDMVQGQPLIHQVLPKVLDFVGDSIIIGHGIKFDIDIIRSAATKMSGITAFKKNRVIDTLRLARHYGESPVNSLEQLRKHFNIEEEGAHRAMNDVIVNVEVFKYLTKRYSTTEELFKILSKPIRLETMPLGKHKGRSFKDVPLEYLYWAAKKDFDEDLIYSIRSEISRRKKGNLFGQSSNPFQNL